MSDRATRLAALLPEAQVDLLLVTDLVGVRYLTGFTGSNALAVVGPRTRAFLTDFRYVEQARTEVEAAFDRRPDERDLFDGVAVTLPAGPVRLGFDDAHLAVRDHERLRRLLPDRVSLIPAAGLVEQLRAVKDPGELVRIRAAAELADAALNAVLADGLAGRTERDLAWALERAIREAGAERAAFEPIVAAGAHGALPHAAPREVAAAPGELVVIDWGAMLDGYCSDCTRTLAAGEPSPAAREVYELVLGAQRAGLAAVRAGVGGREVDAAARTVLEAAGHGEHFGHGLGHGVGLEVHEAPRVSLRSDDTLELGNVVTIEPGVYLPGELGVRIEDLVLVTEAGHEVLTGLGTELLVVD